MNPNLFDILGQMQSKPVFGSPEPMEPAMPSYAPDPNLNGLGDPRQELLRLLGQQPQLQGPVRPVQPAFRTQDAILGLGVPALLALLGGGKGIPAYMQGYMGGKMGKAQSDTQFLQDTANYQNQNAMQNWQTQTNVAKTKLGFAEQDFNRTEADRIRGENADGKMDLERFKNQNKIAADQRKAESNERKAWATAQAQNLDPEGRVAFARQYGFDRDVQDALAELTIRDRQRMEDTKLKEAKRKTEDEMRNPKVKLVNAQIGRIFKTNKLTESQTQLTLKKVGSYDVEYRARVANLNSQILKRTNDTLLGNRKSTTKDVDDEIQDRTRLIGIAKAQIESNASKGFLTEGVEDLTLQNEIMEHQTKIQELIQAKGAAGAAAAPPSADVNRLRVTAMHRVQQLLDAKQIDQAEANKRWRMIKAAKVAPNS